eukprot:TRINITY_DN10322_c0_g1_i1.p1 TRINITY_DN10322_c0_g1~~TRINITY_DN10322_c0_g1_i1.p1  ORF type:complete len:609 (+),score=144.52 TRINITY_DN10322_c0_g1_i1:59-1885(+)
MDVIVSADGHDDAVVIADPDAPVAAFAQQVVDEFGLAVAAANVELLACDTEETLDPAASVGDYGLLTRVEARVDSVAAAEAYLDAAGITEKTSLTDGVVVRSVTMGADTQLLYCFCHAAARAGSEGGISGVRARDILAGLTSALMSVFDTEDIIRRVLDVSPPPVVRACVLSAALHAADNGRRATLAVFDSPASGVAFEDLAAFERVCPSLHAQLKAATSACLGDLLRRGAITPSPLLLYNTVRWDASRDADRVQDALAYTRVVEPCHGIHPLALAASQLRVGAVKLLLARTDVIRDIDALSAVGDIRNGYTFGSDEDEDGDGGRTGRRNTALHFAAATSAGECPEEVVRLLLAAGADPNVCGDGGPAVFPAVERCRWGVVTQLLEANADVAARRNGESFLMLLATVTVDDAAYVAAMEEVLRSGAVDINEIANGCSVLMAAVAAGSLHSARLLIEHGADLTVADRDGATALFHAAQMRGMVDIVQLLTADAATAAATVNRAHHCGQTPLLAAAARRNTPVVRHLLCSGAHVRHADNQGRTALHHTVAGMNLRAADGTIAALVDAGVDRGARAADGKTAYDIAVLSNASQDMLDALRPPRQQSSCSVL